MTAYQIDHAEQRCACFHWRLFVSVVMFKVLVSFTRPILAIVIVFIVASGILFLSCWFSDEIERLCLVGFRRMFSFEAGAPWFGEWLWIGPWIDLFEYYLVSWGKLYRCSFHFMIKVVENWWYLRIFLRCHHFDSKITYSFSKRLSYYHSFNW